ncbi:GyrI-like domain-containing protein [Paenibacillus sp. CMM36]
MSRFEYEIKNLPAYRVVGLKCDVAFTEIETIKDVIQNSIRRVDEFEYAVNTDVRLGLSYHLRPDGFVYYSAYEVQGEQPLIEGMVEVNVPEMTYLVTKHKGGSIEETYEKILEWLNGSEYVPFKEQDVEYYDELPIKHEKYANNSDSSDPHFEILIPIAKP